MLAHVTTRPCQKIFSFKCYNAFILVLTDLIQLGQSEYLWVIGA